MIKSEELKDPKSCLNRARDDEPVFVLLGRDPAAGTIVRRWCHERITLGKNYSDDRQITDALLFSDKMDRYSGGWQVRIERRIVERRQLFQRRGVLPASEWLHNCSAHTWTSRTLVTKFCPDCGLACRTVNRRIGARRLKERRKGQT